MEIVSVIIGLVMGLFIIYNAGSKEGAFMKQVLTIIDSPLLREYIFLKLDEIGISVTNTISNLDSISKMRNTAPDLIIMDYPQNRQFFSELLKQKKLNPNTLNTPVLLFAQKIEQKQLLELVPYNVIKVLSKPLKIDTLFSVISESLKIPFPIDESPGILETNVNENIIFIELANGFNKDKLDLLRFKITELIDIYKIRTPKFILMLSNISLSISDVPRLQKLLFIMIETPKVKPELIMILTKDDFISQFIKTQKKYANKRIMVESDLRHSIEYILAHTHEKTHHLEKSELIGEMLQKPKTRQKELAILKFESEEKRASFELMKDSLQNLRIAVIDDDFVIQEMIKNIFKATNAFVYAFSDGAEFLKVVDTHEFDLAFLDLNMPNIGGLDVLKALQGKNIKYPIIVLSTIKQREVTIKAIQMGIKSYLVKPIKPDDIFSKSMEILKANF
jgi:CheY-like chemotaxis protein